MVPRGYNVKYRVKPAPYPVAGFGYLGSHCAARVNG